MNLLFCFFVDCLCDGGVDCDFRRWLKVVDFWWLQGVDNHGSVVYWFWSPFGPLLTPFCVGRWQRPCTAGDKTLMTGDGNGDLLARDRWRGVGVPTAVGANGFFLPTVGCANGGCERGCCRDVGGVGYGGV